MAQNHSPWFSQLSPCLSTFPRTQVRSRKGRGRWVSEPWAPSVTANSRYEIQGPWLMSITRGITEMIISGSWNWVKLPLLIQLIWEGQQERKEAYRPKVSLRSDQRQHVVQERDLSSLCPGFLSFERLRLNTQTPCFSLNPQSRGLSMHYVSWTQWTWQ